MANETLQQMAVSLVVAERQQSWARERLAEKGFSEEIVKKFEEAFDDCYVAKKGAQYLQSRFGINIERRNKNIPFTEEQLNVAYDNAAEIIEKEASEGKLNEFEKGNCYGIIRDYFSPSLFEKEKSLAELERKSEYFVQLSGSTRVVRTLKAQMQVDGFPINEFMELYFVERGPLKPENVEGSLKM